MNIWTEHRNPEGRTYWFNTGTRESVWEKPDELKTPFERALNQTKWKEYFSGGRKYYYNTETKESKWDMPDELLLVLEKVEKEGQTTAVVPAGQPALIAPPASDANGSQTQPNGNELAVGAHTGGLPLASNSILPARPNLPDDPVIPHNGFSTLEEGEKAFTHLLRKAGVDANWTWDQTMRAIITDPLYKALNSLAEKKSVFEKYTTSLKVKEKEEREARLAKLRPAIRNMLKGNPSVFHYTTFTTADKLFSQHPIWQQARIEAERKLIFEEYIQDLKQRDAQDRSAARTRATAKVVSLFKQLDVDVLTRWRTAHNLILDSDEWKSDHELQKLPSLDILLAFEDYSRVREREYEEQMRRAQVEKTRKERKAREAFKALLRELVESGKIKARCKWKHVYPLFSTDERYLNMLGNPGSNQLELFWDVVDGLDQKLDAKIDVVTEAFKGYRADGVEGDTEASGFAVGPETTEEQYQNILKAVSNANVEALTSKDIHNIYAALHDTAIRKQAEEKRKAEKRQRHLQDDLRYALKKLPEPLDISLSYEAVVPFIEHLPEYKALEDDESRRSAFAKFVKRQKERLREAAGSEDGGSTTSRKRKEPARDGDREHDRERDRDREREREREPTFRERDRNRERGKDYDRDNRRHHYRHDDYDGRRSSREYTRADRDEKDRERDGYRPRHQRDEKDDRRRDRDRDRDRERSSRPDYGPNYSDVPPRKEERDEGPPKEEPREKRDAPDDRIPDDRAEKRPRYDREESVGNKTADIRAETPEEGEI